MNHRDLSGARFGEREISVVLRQTKTVMLPVRHTAQSDTTKECRTQQSSRVHVRAFPRDKSTKRNVTILQVDIVEQSQLMPVSARGKVSSSWVIPMVHGNGIVRCDDFGELQHKYYFAETGH